MLPPNPKHILVEEEPNEKDIPSKRPRTSEITTPVVTKGKSRIDHPVNLSSQQKDKGVYMVPNVKFEDMIEDTLTGTLLKSRSALSPKDLPAECLHGFRVAFKPAIRDFVGTLGPWESPTDADIIRIWNSCFPKHKLGASKGLQTIVSKLVEDIVQYWRRDMATTAVECLNMSLKSSFNKQSERVAHAAWLLGDDEKDRKRPFYYKKYQNGVRPSGIFQSPIIAATFATHLSSISCLPEESRLHDYPTGALALSILTVKRALTWAKTGVDSIPKTSEGHFSRANWGDHYTLENGQYVLTKTASNIVAVINKLRVIQWERVLAEAEKYAMDKSTPTALKALLEEEAEIHSDFEIEDWDDHLE